MPLWRAHTPRRAPTRHHYLNYTETNAEIQKLAAEFGRRARARRSGVGEAACRRLHLRWRAVRTWVLEVTERASLGRSPERPDVLVSGALHGDEIVGPLVTLELGRAAAAAAGGGRRGRGGWCGRGGCCCCR